MIMTDYERVKVLEKSNKRDISHIIYSVKVDRFFAFTLDRRGKGMANGALFTKPISPDSIVHVRWGYWSS